MTYILIEPAALLVNPRDNVAVALRSLNRGEQVSVDGNCIELGEDIAKGHKFAISEITAGEQVTRYGASIGRATLPIRRGTHVHTHNLSTALIGEQGYEYRLPERSAATGAQQQPPPFLGYVRDDGTVATRNELWILPTVGCVGRLGERLAVAGNRAAGSSLDGVHAFNHPFGCSQLGADLESTAAILAALAQNPNAGGVLILGLGCESNQLNALLERIPESRRTRLRTVLAQSEADEFAAGQAAMAELITLMAHDRRQPAPLSALRLGVKCGGSDAMSGLTANPLIGRMADRVTNCGGSAVLTEIPEIFGAEHLLLERAETPEIFDDLSDLVNRFKRYFIDHGEPVSENPSPGNIAGGITTLEEKSLGAVQKGGRAIVREVLGYGEIARQKGLAVLEGPGNDAVSTTALAAAGATLTLFSTGRGTPLGSPVPTLKIASNSALAEKKPGWIDFDAGAVLLDGMDKAADALLAEIIAIASGKPARNEVNDERSIGIWKRGVVL